MRLIPLVANMSCGKRRHCETKQWFFAGCRNSRTGALLASDVSTSQLFEYSHSCISDAFFVPLGHRGYVCAGPDERTGSVDGIAKVLQHQAFARFMRIHILNVPK